MMKSTYVLALALAVGVLGIVVQSASATINSQTLAKNPIGYWNFETSDLTDLSSNGNDLTAEGGATLVAGGPAGSIDAGDPSTMAGNITGTNDTFAVDTPVGNVLNVTGNTITINGWINTADGPSDNPLRTRGFVTKARASPWVCCDTLPWDYGLWLELVHEPDLDPPFQRFRVNSYFGDGFGLDPRAEGDLTPDHLTIGEWHMLTVSADAGMATMYYDGQPINPGGSPIKGAAIGGSISDPYFPRLVLGGNPPNANSHVLGKIDEISIFDYALSDGQVKTLFTGIPEPSTVVLLTTGLLVCYAWRKRR